MVLDEGAGVGHLAYHDIEVNYNKQCVIDFAEQQSRSDRFFSCPDAPLQLRCTSTTLMPIPHSGGLR